MPRGGRIRQKASVKNNHPHHHENAAKKITQNMKKARICMCMCMLPRTFALAWFLLVGPTTTTTTTTTTTAAASNWGTTSSGSNPHGGSYVRLARVNPDGMVLGLSDAIGASSWFEKRTRRIQRSKQIEQGLSTTTTRRMNRSVHVQPAASVKTKVRKRSKTHRIPTTRADPDPEAEAEAESSDLMLQERLHHLARPCLPMTIWNTLTGQEFVKHPETVTELAQTALEVTLYGNDLSHPSHDEDNGMRLEWSPTKRTHKLLKRLGLEGSDSAEPNAQLLSTHTNTDSDTDTDTDESNNNSNDTLLHQLLTQAFSTPPSSSSSSWLYSLLQQETLVWTAKPPPTNNPLHGKDAPLVRTRAIINGMSPRELMELLMDSSRVKLYNTMSLGRVDLYEFPSASSSAGAGGGGGSHADGRGGGLVGMTKIVRNRTKPPITKRAMEFVTLMHARPLWQKTTKPKISMDQNESESSGEEDNVVVVEYMLDQGDANKNDFTTEGMTTKEEGGYIVVSRAVGGSTFTPPTTITSSSSSAPDSEDCVRSDILLGVNLLRPIPGMPNQTDLLSVTHAYTPVIPAVMAKSVGVKGAMDFVSDVRRLGLEGGGGGGGVKR